MLMTISGVSVTANTTGTYNLTPLSHPTTEINITIQNFTFNPDNVTITTDTIVTWTNLALDPHTVTSDTGVFNSGLLILGQKFSFTFTEAGTYQYHCAIHPFMHGVIIVTGAGNLPPNKPTLTGQKKGNVGATYTYTAMAIDPENMTISYFFDWGDTTNSGWTPFVISGTAVNMSHAWSTKGSYTITVKAKDEHGGISPTTTFSVSMPCEISTSFNSNHMVFQWLINLLNHNSTQIRDFIHA